MACSLTPSTTGKEDFTAKAGTKFTIDMTGPATSGLVVVAATYNQTTIIASNAPFTFTAVAGLKIIFIHYEAVVKGAKLQVVEVCGTTQQVLETMHFDPGNPGTGLEIRA